jgi:chromosome partitioning protein
VGDNLSLVPSDIDLAAAEVELAGIVGREVILREAMALAEQKGSSPVGRELPDAIGEFNAARAGEANQDDFVLLDCGPSLGILTLNALAAADEVFIPLQPHFLALHGLSKLLETTALVARRINPRLIVSGVVVCLYDAGTKLAQEVVADLSAFLDKSRGSNVPWAGARVFATRIRRNIKLAECPSFGKSVFQYAPKSSGASDYAALANEVLGATNPLVFGPVKMTTEDSLELPSRQTSIDRVA